MAGYTTPRKGTYRKYTDAQRAAYWKKKYFQEVARFNKLMRSK